APVAPPSPTAAPTYSGDPVGGMRAQAEPARAQVEDTPPPGFNKYPPSLSSNVYQYYLPVDYPVETALRNWEQWTRQPVVQVETRKRLLYRPALLAQTVARFTHRPTGTSETYTYAFVVPTLPRVPMVDWGEYVSSPFDPYSLDGQPFSEAYYADLPSNLSSSSGFTDLKGNLVDWIYYNAALYVYHNPVLKVYSGIDEDQQTFITRVQALAREARDSEIDTVAARYDSKLASLEARAQKKAIRMESEREELEARKREELITGAESLMQLMKGRAYYTLSRTSRMRRYTNTSQDQLGLKERELIEIADALEATEREMEASLQAVHDKWAEAIRQIEEVKISPLKKDIDVMLFGVGWVPYWDTTINSTLVILPASSSSLTQAQDPTLYDSGGGGYY
nr:hypothetical protein [Anaerolineae bacterium]